jgi:hypothetical protein
LQLIITCRPYTNPPVELVIGPEEIIHYVSRHFLPPKLDHNGSTRKLYLRDMDIVTGHTLIHYFHTGLYQTTNAEGDSLILTTRIKLKQAVSVYLATIEHDIPSLSELAISEMKAHASKLNFVETIQATKEGVQKLDSESWLHGYLQQKARIAFEEDKTVFTSEAFLESLDNAKVNKFLMKCVTESYDKKISNMVGREEVLSQSLKNCQQSLQVLSQPRVILEQKTPVQHQFITPLANDPSTSECCGNEAFREDLISNGDFCTISCPPSMYSSEARGCLEEPKMHSAETGEHCQYVRKCGCENNLAGPTSSEQHTSSGCLAPDLSLQDGQAPIGCSTMKQCQGETTRNHLVLELKPSKDGISAQSIIDEKKALKKQKKVQKRKERREMIELWEMTKRKRPDTAICDSNTADSVCQPEYQNEVHKGPKWRADGGDMLGKWDPRITDLRAALTAILNDVESIELSSNSI